MVECLNQGLAASGAVVHVLACGVQVCPGWADAALRHFGNPAIAAVGAVVLRRDDRRRTISAGLGYRAEGTAWRLDELHESGGVAACPPDFCGPDTLAAFYRRSVVQSLGGLSSWAGDSLAGIDLCWPCGTPVFVASWSRDVSRTWMRQPPMSSRHSGGAATSKGSSGVGRRATVGCLPWPPRIRACWRGRVSRVFGGRRCCAVGRPGLGRAATDLQQKSSRGGQTAGGSKAVGDRCPAFRHREVSPTAAIAPRGVKGEGRNRVCYDTSSRSSSGSTIPSACSSGPAAPRRVPG